MDERALHGKKRQEGGSDDDDCRCVRVSGGYCCSLPLLFSLFSSGIGDGRLKKERKKKVVVPGCAPSLLPPLSSALWLGTTPSLC